MGASHAIHPASPVRAGRAVKTSVKHRNAPNTISAATSRTTTAATATTAVHPAASTNSGTATTAKTVHGAGAAAAAAADEDGTSKEGLEHVKWREPWNVFLSFLLRG